MEASRVTDNLAGGQEKPGPGFLENKRLMIAGILIAVLIIAVIAVVVFQEPADRGTSKQAVIKNNTSRETSVSFSGAPKITKVTRPAGTKTPTKIPPTEETISVPVDFILRTGTPSSCGLTCRQLDASIANAGYAIAHNVCIDVSMYNSRNEIINLNGEPSLNRCIGDIGGGESKTEAIIINADCGVFATKCIGETLTLKTRVSSDEKTIQFPDQLIAV
jgi:hypothetical protein